MNNNDKPIILVDLHSGGQMKQVSLKPDELAQKSQKALEQAMKTIQGMAQQTIEMIDTLTNKPSEVEVEFGIKLDVQSGALIAKAGGEANLTVKLLWKRED